MRPGLSGPNGPLNVLGAGQSGLVWRDKSRVHPGNPADAAESTKASKGAQSFGICILKTLAEERLSTRLETRTKESNMYASWRVVNP